MTLRSKPQASRYLRSIIGCRTLRVLLMCALMSPLAAQLALGANLPVEVQARLGQAVFEVVMAKPVVDSMSYEKPLPLELLSYTERTDKYRSIGTAFCIAPNTYVSAAHVFDAGLVTQYGEPALRDSAGNVHAVDQVLKYSSERDFIVFSLKQPIPGQPLVVNRVPVLNTPVFAAGNALGEGIVVRDGLFTSETPEEINGRWKWLRFSAAASPGNSGGALLDNEGRVMGVVLRKSENENLNYAVPIAQVLDAPDKLASGSGYYSYILPLLDVTEGERLNLEFKLPKTFSAFAQELVRLRETEFDRLQKQLLTKNADSIFPNGPGSVRLLNSSYSSTGLQLMMRTADASWDAFSASSGNNATLQQNGFVSVGALAATSILKVRRPDDVAAAEFYSNSKLYMDYLLKAVPLQRPVGQQRIRITSLGPAKTESSYTDVFGRKWQVRTWTMEREDMVVVSFAMAVPEGYVAMMRGGNGAFMADTMRDLRVMTAFANVSLSGTLEQWRDYLAQKALLPTRLADIDIDFEYGERFRYQSKRLQLALTPAQQAIQKDSSLLLSFGLFKDGGKLLWDVTGVSLDEKKVGGQSLAVTRHIRPDPSLPDSFQNDWTRMITRAYPYNGTVIEDGGNVYINAIHPASTGAVLVPGGSDANAKTDKTNLLYRVYYGNEGKHSDDDVKTALNGFLTSLKIVE